MANPLRYLLAPWWAASLASGAKSFVDNPLIGSRLLNEKGLHVARLKLAHSMAWKRRERLAGLISPGDKTAFDRDGYVVKRDFLAPELFAALREHLQAWRGPVREMLQGDAITRRMALNPALLGAVPEAQHVLDNPSWRGLTRYASSYDIEPVSYVQTILSHQGEGRKSDPQLVFHADSFQPSMKAWLFLEDVSEEDGPFAYVPGSHLLTPQRIAWERRKSLEAPHADRLTSRGSFRVERTEIAAMGLPDPVPAVVPANTLVVADTFGFHARSPSMKPSRRVEIWAYSRRNPYLPWTGLDISGIPYVARRKVDAYWRFRDRLKAQIGQPWRYAGEKSAFDW